MKASVVLNRDEDKHPSTLEIKIGHKKLKVKYIYRPDGDVCGFEVSGRRELLPSVTDLFKIVDAKRLDRIDTIELIDLITEITNIKNIESIDLIDKISEITEITKIRSLINKMPTLMANPWFEDEFTGWNKAGTVSITSTGLPPTYMALFEDLKTGWLAQRFGIALGVDWMTEFYCEIFGFAGMLNEDLIRVTYYYTDGTISQEVFQVTAAGWNKTVLSPTAGKYIVEIMLTHLATHRKCGVSRFIMVF